MTRAQCLVHRGRHILMVKHSMRGQAWWCLPGGGVEPQKTPSQAALRELEEECRVNGRLIRQVGHVIEADGVETVTFLIDIGSQEPKMGSDPEFAGQAQILVDMCWLTLPEIPERDRAYLWASGLMSISEFLEEVTSWGDALSYPAHQSNV